MDGLNFSSSFNRRRKRKALLLGSVIVLLLALLLFFLLRNRQANADLQAAYEKASAQTDFDEIVAIHAEAQIIIADSSDKNSESASALLAETVRLRDEIETELAEFTQSRIEAVKAGHSLSEGDAEKLSLSMTIVGASSLEQVDLVLQDYLLDVISEAEYKHFLETLYPVQGFQRFLQEQVNDFYKIRDFKAELAPACQLLQDAEYIEAANAFAELKDTDYAQIKAVDRILDDLRAESLDHLFALHMPEIERLMESGRSYDADLIIESIIEYLPDRAALTEAQAANDKLLPASVVNWSNPIDAISIKPLIADPDRAFDNDRYSEMANKELLTAAEFRLLLEVLYQNDYVLVHANEIVDEDGKLQSLIVPADKKPLLLFLDEFYFTPERIESGVCARLDLNAKQEVVGVVQDRMGGEELSDNATAINVLENFLQEHQDFSFNGAKGVIVLSGVDGLLGYPLLPEQSARQLQQAQNIGLEFQQNPLDNLDANREKLAKIFAALRERQWLFASQSYGRLSIPDYSLAAISADTERMHELTVELCGPLEIFSFTGGNHAEGQPMLTKHLAESGFRLQSGSAAPYAYTIQNNAYVYLDKQQITADKLRYPLSDALSKLVGDRQIITEIKRP